MVADLGLDANPPAGMILHVASEAVGAVNVLEVWQTPQAAESYVEGGSAPHSRRSASRSRSAYRIEPMRNLFAPEMDTVERIGATALARRLRTRARVVGGSATLASG